MKSLILAVVAIASFACPSLLPAPAMAQGIENSPAGLAKEMSDQAKLLSGVVARSEALAKRVNELEEHEIARTKKEAKDAYVASEVERRLSGVQGQITILHSMVSNKADKAELQKTRDQVANCLNMLKQRASVNSTATSAVSADNASSAK